MRQGFLSNPFLDQTYHRCLLLLLWLHIGLYYFSSFRSCLAFPAPLSLVLFSLSILYTPHNLTYASMTTSKAIQIAKDIEDARCKGNWKLMPELARRYRKHNPKGEGINTTPRLPPNFFVDRPNCSSCTDHCSRSIACTTRSGYPIVFVECWPSQIDPAPIAVSYPHDGYSYSHW